MVFLDGLGVDGHCGGPPKAVTRSRNGVGASGKRREGCKGVHDGWKRWVVWARRGGRILDPDVT